MASFLTRLIQRTSGRASVIKPLIRSTYGSLPPVNESIGEFEETVDFNGISVPSSANTHPEIRNNLSMKEKVTKDTSSPFVGSGVDNLLVKSTPAASISQPN